MTALYWIGRAQAIGAEASTMSLEGSGIFDYIAIGRRQEEQPSIFFCGSRRYSMKSRVVDIVLLWIGQPSAAKGIPTGLRRWGLRIWKECALGFPCCLERQQEL